MTKNLIINFCNQCPFYFYDINEYEEDEEEHLCLNIKLGDSDGAFLPQGNKTENGFIIPKWCPLEEWIIVGEHYV